MFTQLDASKIIATVDRLERRIVERFPDSSLRRVSSEISASARQSCDTADSLGKPHWPLRIAAYVLILALIIAAVGALGALIARVATEETSGFGSVTDLAGD